MRITILTLFPEMYEGFINTSIINRARQSNKVSFNIVNIRDYTTDKHGHVDDTPFGGGKGMVMQVQPLYDALMSHKASESKVILMGPIGPRFNQSKARELALEEDLVLVCGHYEGIDERFKGFIDEELSIGDYILTGGELASMVISDAIIRLLDGVIEEESHLNESFENGLLEHPHYTKPQDFRGLKVPDVLLSGHHKNIEKYRLKESLRLTYIHRKDLLDNYKLDKDEKNLLNEVIGENENGNN